MRGNIYISKPLPELEHKNRDAVPLTRCRTNATKYNSVGAAYC